MLNHNLFSVSFTYCCVCAQFQVVALCHGLHVEVREDTIGSVFSSIFMWVLWMKFRARAFAHLFIYLLFETESLMKLAISATLSGQQHWELPVLGL